MPEDLTPPEEFPSPRDRAFGDIVVAMGLADRQAVNAAMAGQMRYVFAGMEVPPLPRLLVAANVISRSQAERALALLASRAQEGDPGLAPDADYADTSRPVAAPDEGVADLVPAPEAGTVQEAPVIIRPGEAQAAAVSPAAPAPPAPAEKPMAAPRITYPTDTGTVEIIMPVGHPDEDTVLKPEDGPAPAPQPPASQGAPGEPIKGYKIISRISQDETGAIFKARQLAMDRLVALKILPPKMTADRAFVDRFLTEARNAGQLNHPSLTRVHEIGRTDKYYFYSMELVEGKTLEDNIKLGGRMEALRALQVIREVCRAVEHMAAKGLVHGEISPRAVTITGEGVVKLSMAGLGGARGSTRYLVGDRYHYVAPERALSSKFDVRADLYSAGALLYYGLTGQHPYTGANANEVLSQSFSQPPPDPRLVVPELAADVARVVVKAMDKDPAGRYRSPAEMLAALEPAMAAAKPRAGLGARPPTRVKTAAVARRIYHRRRRR
jgi:serine/threonine-protein kinase